NGTEWLQRTIPGPSPRYGHVMAFDSARGVTVLFGGENSYHYLADTWEWNGTNWTQRTPLAGPSQRVWSALAYDSARGVAVLFGGFYSSGGVYGNVWWNDTWAWNGTTWTQDSPATSPPAMSSYAMAYDAPRGATVLFGWGTWELTGTLGSPFIRQHPA